MPVRVGLLLLATACGREPTPDASDASDASEAQPIAVPTRPGLHVQTADAWRAVEDSVLRLHVAEEPDGSRTRAWCLDPDRGHPVALPPGPRTFLDDGDARWRPFRLDPEGCAWRERRDADERWVVVWREGLAQSRDRLPDGRHRYELDLPAGDWFLADWDRGFFTPAPSLPAEVDAPTDAASADAADVPDTPPGTAFTGAWLKVGDT